MQTEQDDNLDSRAAYLREWLERAHSIGASLLLASLSIEVEVSRAHNDPVELWAWKTQVRQGELSKQVADHIRQALQLITDSAFVLLEPQNPMELPVRAILKHSNQLLSQSLAEEENERGLSQLSINSRKDKKPDELHRIIDRA